MDQDRVELLAKPARSADVIGTARALKHRGFDRTDVTAAMEKTNTHVGTAELTLEQWIRIASSYWPSPRAVPTASGRPGR